MNIIFNDVPQKYFANKTNVTSAMASLPLS